MNFPISRSGFLRTMYYQLLLFPLAKFILVRAKYNATGTDKNPYMKKGVKLSKTAVRVGLLYLLALVASLTYGVYSGDTLLLAVLPAALFIAAVAAFLLLPASAF